MGICGGTVIPRGEGETIEAAEARICCRAGCFSIKARPGRWNAGRSPSMRRRVSANRRFGTATSANWNVAHRPWLAILALIFTSSALDVVCEKCVAP